MTGQRNLTMGVSVVWLCTVLLSSLAYAQPGPIKSTQLAAQEAEARDAFEAGRDAYEQGLFAQALLHFERAHALSRLPELLFNIARAADSDGRAARAIDAYSSYLEAFPSADNAAFVRARLAKLSALERGEHSHAPASSSSDPDGPVERDGDARGARDEGGAQPSAETSRESPSVPADRKQRSFTPAVITLGVVGLASAGAFVGYALAAQRGYDRCDGPRYCSDREFSDAYRKKVYLADGFGAAALAAVATASVLFFVQRARDRRVASPVDVGVALSPGHGKVVVHGTF